MPRREINAKEILQDIRTGMDERCLMDKYMLTDVGLKAVLGELVSAGLLKRSGDAYLIPETKRIDAKKIAADIVYGMTAQELMRRYNLTPMLLRQALEQLLESHILTRDQLGRELALRMDASDPSDIRSEPRETLSFDVDVFEPSRPDLVGRILEISERGFRVTGITVRSGEIKKLVIGGDLLGQVPPFELEAKCCWTRDLSNPGNAVAGFRIVNVSERARGELRKLVELAGLKYHPPGYDVDAL
jgi:hypothetical protein